MATAHWNELTNHSADHLGYKAPSKFLMLAEYRFLGELGLSLATAPLLLRAPRGEGQPVLVLPGFLTSDLSTNVLRNFLKRRNYDARTWNLGRNFGGVYKMRAGLRQRLTEIHEETGQKVSIVGWSLGGIYARMLALDSPGLVRSVITLGSPFSRALTASNVGKIYNLLTGELMTDEERAARALLPHEFDHIRGDLGLPATSIWSKVDGIVSWQASVIEANDHAENIEVIGASHLGLGVNPAVFWAVADRLHQPEGTFAPFKRNGPFSLGYGKPITREDLVFKVGA